MVSRTVALEKVELSDLTDLTTQREIEEAATTELIGEPPKIDMKNIARSMELARDWMEMH